MKKEENQLPEGLTQDQMDSWKDKWPSVETVSAPLNELGTEVIDVVLKSPAPDRKVCGQFERFIDTNPDKAREILIQNCVLHGKDKVLANNYAFRAVSLHLIEMFPDAKVTLKN